MYGQDSPARRVYEASTAAFAIGVDADRLNASTPMVQPEDGWSVVYAKRTGMVTHRSMVRANTVRHSATRFHTAGSVAK